MRIHTKTSGPFGRPILSSGNSETGWIDALAGRQVLRFGDERVIGA